jgi:hypothetical protein
VAGKRHLLSFLMLSTVFAAAAANPGEHTSKITVAAGESVTFDLASSEVGKIVPAVRLVNPDAHYPHVKVTVTSGTPSFLIVETNHTPGVSLVVSVCQPSAPCSEPFNVGALKNQTQKLELPGMPTTVVLSEFRWARISAN